MIMRRTYRGLPDLPESTVLSTWRLSLVKPITRTNLILNPSVETNTTGYTAVGGSIARSTTYSYHGAYSLAVTPSASTTSGVYYETVSTLTSGTTYAASVKIIVPNAAGRRYRLAFATTGGVMLQAKEFIATGRWQWVSVIYAETSSTTRRIYISKQGGTETAVFYIDGLQLEACETGNQWPTTYIDGDQQGLLGDLELTPAYYWAGTPHASTSVRSGQTRAGGQVKSLQSYGFLVTAILGLGLAPVQTVVTTFGQLDGAQYLDQRNDSRSFTLNGRWQASTPRRLETQQAALAADLGRDAIATRQPVVLLAEPLDADDTPIRAPISITGAAYIGGLEGSLDGLPSAETPLTFTQFLPLITTNETGVALDPQDTFSAYHLAIRTPGGVWSNMGSGITTAGVGSTAVRTFGVFYSSGQAWIVAGGDFGALGFAANTIGIGYYNPLNGGWGAMGSGGAANAIVNKVLTDASGLVYAFGGFTAMGGAATSANAARWDPTANTWTGLNAPGAVASFQTAAIGPNGTIYTADGATIRQYVPSTGTWSTLGTAAGASSLVYALTVGPDGSLYVGGSFTSVSAVSMNGVGRYTLTASTPAWEALTGGAPTSVPTNGAVSNLAFDASGKLYATVFLLTGTTIAPFHQWNGTQWNSIGNLTLGLGSGGNGSIPTSVPGGAYVFGDFTTTNGVTLPERAGLWNGSVVVPLDIDMPVARAVLAMYQLIDGTLVMSRFDSVIAPTAPSSGTSVAAGLTTATNTSGGVVYPTLTINGPSSGTSRIYQLVNITTGAAVYFNLTINAGEVVTVQFTPTRASAISSFRGNVLSSILPGSTLTNWALQPGANTISLFADSSTVTATLRWSNTLPTLAQGWTQ